MKRKLYIGFIGLLALVLGIQTCVKKDLDYPELPNVPKGAVLKIKEIKEIVKGDDATWTFKEDKSVYGYVISSQKQGRKTFFF